jgi:hypothetical protein
MPTRTGCDYHALHPDWFVCAYCYQAWPKTPITEYKGMIKKRVRYRIDDSLDDFVAIPGAWTEVWTEPHCYPCNRQVRGEQNTHKWPNRFKYA